MSQSARVIAVSLNVRLSAVEIARVLIDAKPIGLISGGSFRRNWGNHRIGFSAAHHLPSSRGDV
jgi:hypothetical protein